MLKLVALDVDGTLLNREGEITGRTLRAIGDLRQAGVEFTLCTGRNLPLARRYAEALEITLPIVTCNGAEIRRLDGGVVGRRPIPQQLAKQVYGVLREHDALFDIYRDDRIVIESKPRHLRRLLRYYRTVSNINREYEALLEEELERPYMLEAHDIGVWLDQEAAGVEKFFVMEENPQRFEAMFAQLCALPGIGVATSHRTSIEVNDCAVDKGKALARLAASLDIAPEEIAAVGDGMNDVPMFAFAGISVAMGNATEQVKRHAKFVTASHSEEGLAQALERWL